MIKLLRKYFSKCGTISIIVTNIIWLIVTSPMPIFGLLFFFGVLHTPKLQERLTGIGIFILMGIIFIIFNIINYFIHRHKQPQEKIVKRVIISLVVIITCGIILYTAPDVWATINDWWF